MKTFSSATFTPAIHRDKTILQLVDADAKLRIDLFRSCGGAMSRTFSLDLSGYSIKIISLEDLTARTARLALDLAAGMSTSSKYATDFLRLIELVHPAEVETAWLDHRKPGHPVTFREAVDLLQDLMRRARIS